MKLYCKLKEIDLEVCIIWNATKQESKNIPHRADTISVVRDIHAIALMNVFFVTTCNALISTSPSWFC